jgi:hypothetical protein
MEKRGERTSKKDKKTGCKMQKIPCGAEESAAIDANGAVPGVGSSPQKLRFFGLIHAFVKINTFPPLFWSSEEPHTRVLKDPAPLWAFTQRSDGPNRITALNFSHEVFFLTLRRRKISYFFVTNIHGK